MYVIVMSSPHRHCDFCCECLLDGAPSLRYRCGDIWLERSDGRAPSLYEAGEWRACVDCSVAIEDGDVKEIVERVMIALEDRVCEHEADYAREGVRRLIVSFLALREKTRA